MKKREKKKSALDEFLALARKYGMTYAELQQKETLMKLFYRTPKDENVEYRSKNEEAAGN